MSVIYFHIQGFYFNNAKKRVNEMYYYEIVNDQNGARRTNFFKGSDASAIKKSYNLKVNEIGASFTIKLYQKVGINNELIGTLNIPISYLPEEKVTFNTLEVDCKNPKDHVACRIILHLSNGEPAYKAPQVIPVLPQMDIFKYSKSQKTHCRVDINSIEAPLLSSRAY
ncbi:hypothetical protein TVAG_255750 [Trichomonas vaginalis G3]|uniref:Uncharacterized protein n=1 Tax=Trichomonas vaginalis (strain ATCC PRA-98 / G3) TaxID=412133 RepID=A2DYX2_TRIV3|nr:hypothetical protein TVAGG3_0869340 [Trichomonas vaginalis G3]EAY14383.1 hypothetical protein TVAG_255750 [Trichomonas vaginalis G3]KAI5501258.1 hypothetical protein TVAGG3_0869340 [Trichomonas vaginalis G3]|eukprot:XP_001326606.1 hypothetical protein [Trichomonas vaginalis G3]